MHKGCGETVERCCHHPLLPVVIAKFNKHSIFNWDQLNGRVSKMMYWVKMTGDMWEGTCRNILYLVVIWTTCYNATSMPKCHNLTNVSKYFHNEKMQKCKVLFKVSNHIKFIHKCPFLQCPIPNASRNCWIVWFLLLLCQPPWVCWCLDLYCSVSS